MIIYKITWEVNQWRPDEFSSLSTTWVDIVEAQNESEAIEDSHINVSYAQGGGRMLTIAPIA